MFVAMTRFRLRFGQETMVRDAFGRRPMKVEKGSRALQYFELVSE